MVTHFADKFYEAAAAKGAPVCVGIDPVFSKMPKKLTGGADVPDDDQHAAEVFEKYTVALLEAVAPYTPIVKPQLACFERYHAAGFVAYHNIVQAAQGLGIMVLADGKRGDIGISSDHYANGLLGSPDGADALTVNPYLGMDGVEPFVKLAAAEGKGIFALVRTSNPGSDGIQSHELADGRTVAQMVADEVFRFGRGDKAYIGDCGYSLLGAVVGATKSSDAKDLRERMSEQIFLVPGFGAQGGTADDVRACFNENGTGAIITASRSVIYAYMNGDGSQQDDWKSAIAAGAKDLNEQIAAILK
ncbi:Orotidine 5'-phosphate decarboxylase [Poriferisphaera corsica]|uniref:Orotidine 5'-phosphate decarboxylase n=1 Tax=Poriferisphaera corsica TaxID=2528020 RepID=A0A517YSW2_9BACT|nr:orotidine-5'-phosphate decarboxylase [Poriferisphaera corsica]QDU33327.1 Orotidine 5'-phosphate decarboxylase [Poriferisphaera corsica]